MEIDDVWRLPVSGKIAVAGQRLQDSSDQVDELSLSTGQVQALTHDLAAYSSLRASRDDRALLAVQNLTLSSVQVIAPGKDPEPRMLSVSYLNRDGIAGLAWTPDNKIVYTSEPGSREVIETNRDGTGPRRLALANLQAFSDPVISPRGDFIAVVRWKINDSANIWRMNLDGNEQKRLTEGRQDFSPSISPDGQWIVYAGVEGGSSAVMKVPAGGGAPVRVTNLCADNPAISPDGKWIACTVVSDPADRPKLAILPFSGSTPDKAFELSTTVEVPPLVWTPDNRSISFIETVDGVSNVWKQPVDGGPAVPVTHFTSGRIFNFRWSKDGWLALARGTVSADAVLIRDPRDGH
jgi:Tol biopolymer transport system component